MKPTNKLRHVWREVSDGSRTRTVLALQQYWEDDLTPIRDDESYAPESNKSEWRDVKIDVFN